MVAIYADRIQFTHVIRRVMFLIQARLNYNFETLRQFLNLLRGVG